MKFFSVNSYGSQTIVIGWPCVYGFGDLFSALRKSLSTVSNNQLAQLDLHDLDLNDLNLAMGAFVALLLVVVVVFLFLPGFGEGVVS